jgi:hypothetical protein
VGGDGRLEPAARSLAELLWGALARRLARAREELERWLARTSPGERLADGDALARHEELSAELERAGWCLAVLASALGHELARARREPRGLAWMLAAAAEAGGFELAPPPSELPRLGATTGPEVEVQVLAAAGALEASRTRPGPVRWEARARGNARELSFALGAGPAAPSVLGDCGRVRVARSAHEVRLCWSADGAPESEGGESR